MWYKKYYCLGLLLFLNTVATAQLDTNRFAAGRYFFEGPCIAFEFNTSTYTAALGLKDSLYIEFTDLDLLEGTTHPEAWSKEGWTMVQIGPDQFQIRKNIEDFKDKPNWLLRLLSVELGVAAPDSALLKQNIEGWYEIENPNIVDPVETETGNVLFQLKGFTDRVRVVLTGSFNHWDEEALLMKRTAEGWALRLQLNPGLYHYKFIADGEWMHDPANKQAVVNEYSTLNSVLEVSQNVRFYLPGFTDANSIILSGSFNKWNQETLRMQKSETGWLIELPLTSGKYEYKYIVDGTWILDPTNLRIEKDRKGNDNSVIFVK